MVRKIKLNGLSPFKNEKKTMLLTKLIFCLSFIEKRLKIYTSRKKVGKNEKRIFGKSIVAARLGTQNKIQDAKDRCYAG